MGDREKTAGASLKVSLLQFAPVWEDRAATREKIDGMLAGQDLGDWLVLPEMALSGFSPDATKAAWDEADTAFFSRLAREQRCCITVGGSDGSYNTAYLFDKDGRLLPPYRKRQLFSYAREAEFYRAGSEACRYQVGPMAVGQAICYDLRFPYIFWDEAPSLDAFCVIAAWGAKRRDHWRCLCMARAIENQLYVIAVNRVGSEPKVDYSGDSCVIDPAGHCLLDCGSAEGLFSLNLEPGRTREWRRDFPALADRQKPGF